MTTFNKQHLQPWYDKWLEEHKNTGLIYANIENPSLHQVHFVRDHLAELFWRDIPYDQRSPASPRDDHKETAYVIGEHHSKSVRLPVFSLERPDIGLQIVMRDNFHDWNVSVVSETPINGTDLRGFELDYANDKERERFRDGYTSGRTWSYCYFQGFPENVQFGPFCENSCRFSLCIGDNYNLYTFVYLVMRNFRGPQ